MPTELEAKFRADGPEPLDALADEASLGAAGLGRGRTVDEVDRYLDTADGRLAAAGWACRHRLRGGLARLSLKGPPQPTGDAWHHRRPEVEGPATSAPDPGAWPPSDARDRLAALSGGAPLVQRLVLRQRRTERAVLVGSERVATLSLDTVEVGGAERGGAEPGRERAPLLIVELELADETALDPTAFDALAGALLARGGLRADPRTKLEHALDEVAIR